MTPTRERLGEPLDTGHGPSPTQLIFLIIIIYNKLEKYFKYRTRVNKECLQYRKEWACKKFIKEKNDQYMG